MRDEERGGFATALALRGDEIRRLLTDSGFTGHCGAFGTAYPVLKNCHIILGPKKSLAVVILS